MITDLFSKYTRCLPAKHPSAGEAAVLLLEQWCCIYGFPEHIVSDRGGAFISDLNKAIMDLCEVKLQVTAAYHQSANGQTERFNQTMATMLTNYVGKDHKDWDVKLQQVVLAYNTLPHANTKEMPFFEMIGRTPVLQGSVYDQLDDEIGSGEDSNWKFRLGASLERSHANVRENSTQNKIKSETARAKKMVEHDFKVSDLVWLYVSHVKKGLSPKFSSPWQGPFRIVWFDGANNVRIVSPGNQAIGQVVHISRLKKYVMRYELPCSVEFD